MAKVRFLYSWAYDSIYAELYNLKKAFIERTGGQWFKNAYYSSEKVEEYTKKVRKRRQPIEKEVMTKIEETFEAKRKEETIVCYCVGYCHMFLWLSSPLTLCVWCVKDVDVIGLWLIHELIHIKQSQEWEPFRAFIKHMEQTYWFDQHTASHILLFSVLQIITSEVLEAHLIEKQKQGSQRWAYKIAWDFLEKHGAEHIINLFHKIKKGDLPETR